MRMRINRIATTIGAAIGIKPTTFFGRLNSSSGTIASSRLIALLISWSSRNRLHQGIEPAFKGRPVPVCVSAKVDLRMLAVRFNHRPGSLMCEKEDAAKSAQQQREPD